MVCRWALPFFSAAPSPSGPALPKEELLSADERTYIWDIEHHGNLLSQKGFKAISQALSQGDEKSLYALLAEKFEGRVPGPGAEVVPYEQDLVKVTRRTAAGEYQHHRPHQFVAQMLAFRKLFSAPPKVAISLILLSPTTRYDFDSVWQGSCLLRMSGFWAKGKPAEVVLNVEFKIARPFENMYSEGGWLQSPALSRKPRRGRPRNSSSVTSPKNAA